MFAANTIDGSSVEVHRIVCDVLCIFKLTTPTSPFLSMFHFSQQIPPFHLSVIEFPFSSAFTLRSKIASIAVRPVVGGSGSSSSNSRPSWSPPLAVNTHTGRPDTCTHVTTTRSDLLRRSSGCFHE